MNNNGLYKIAEDAIVEQLRLLFEKREQPPTYDELREAAEERRKTIKVIYDFSDEEFEEVMDDLESQFTTFMEEDDNYIQDESTFSPWLNNENKNIAWNLFNRYEAYLLREKHWPTKVVSNIRDTSKKIVSLLGNPRQSAPFLRRGLVIGDVQSGKTATYTAICARAADVGYNLIIVLTGRQEDLRQQTQGRLEEELVGKNSEGKEYPAVTKYNEKNVEYRISTLTSEEFDFGKKNAKFAGELKYAVEQTTILFVCKKNKDTLKALNAKMAQLEGPDGKVDKSLLIIDDESDDASANVSTTKVSMINKSIRTLMHHFTKCSYVGVTATPFANIFIRPDLPLEGVSAERLQNDELYKDLFPSDFIYALGYPSNYIGAKGIFGTVNEDDPDKPGEYGYMLEAIDQNDIEQVFPAAHKKDFKPQRLPHDLYKAMYYFILAIAVRDLRGDGKEHKTMIIHISRYMDVHREIEFLVRDWLEKVQRDVFNYAARSVEDAEQNSQEIKNLHKVFCDMNVEEMAGISWEEMQHKYLNAAAGRIGVYVQNGDKRNEPVNYKEHKENGLCAIVIGGNSLSRGLTLEGLCVSYFYRNAKCYDTLMQMGRWFGYRPKYDDLCRIWLTESAIANYTLVSEALEELKDEIDEMRRCHLTPKDFGLRVREDPNSVMMVTARNKMRAAEDVEVPVDICAKFIDASQMKYEPDSFETIAYNNELIKNFLSRMPEPTPDEYDVVRPKYFWRGIAKEKVANLVRSLKTSHMNYKFQPEALADYIENNMDDVLWDVAIPGKNDAESMTDNDFIEVSIHNKQALIRPMSYSTIIDVRNGGEQIVLGGKHSRITYPSLGRIGLSKEEVKAIEDRSPISIKTGKRKIVSASGYMKTKRRPLLLLYLIRPKHEENVELPELISTIGIGFPDNGNKNRTVRYRLNQVALRQEYAVDEGETEE